jgi:hypothetical protein
MTATNGHKPPPSLFECYFGDPWPSGVCEDGTQVPTPVGKTCSLCDEPVQEGDQGTFQGVVQSPASYFIAPVHRECSLRAVMGGIGHLEDHAYWCGEMHDPDGGRSYRASAILVWHWIQVRGFPGVL